MARAPGLGPGGRRFEPCRPDQESAYEEVVPLSEIAPTVESRNEKRGCRIVVITAGFQPAERGSIPLTRSNNEAPRPRCFIVGLFVSWGIERAARNPAGRD